MAENTKIQWAHHTFNPWRGCTKVSDGCKFCYADQQSKRNPGTLGIWGPNGKRVVAAESYWRQPLKWNREASAVGERRRVFCASMADVFEDWQGLMHDTDGERSVYDMTLVRKRLFRLIDDTPNLDWLLLTKRPENVAKILIGLDRNLLPPNVWIGTSVENQATADERIPHLLRVPATVRFLSCEPLLGPVDLRFGKSEGKPTDSEPFRERADLLHWAIVGGESGSKARPCDIEWIRDIVRQCREAGVAPFVKQLGANATDAPENEFDPGNEVWRLNLRDTKGGDISEWPPDLRVRELPNGVTEDGR